MHNYKELQVWQRAMNLAVNTYNLTSYFSEKEQRIFSSQLSRCAISIASNIAEGAGKESSKDFCRYLSISEGSSFELETQLIIIMDLIPSCKEKVEALLVDAIIIQKMIYKLRISNKRK